MSITKLMTHGIQQLDMQRILPYMTMLMNLQLQFHIM